MLTIYSSVQQASVCVCVRVRGLNVKVIESSADKDWNVSVQSGEGNIWQTEAYILEDLLFAMHCG